jgi:hypothetical protein
MNCKNCGHKLRIDPFEEGRVWKHSGIVEEGGKKKMVSYSITCHCGCTKPEPENKKSEEIVFLGKVLERLKGYACGEHKQLEKMIINRKNNVKAGEKKHE